jgi:hypothetical protein
VATKPSYRIETIRTTGSTVETRTTAADAERLAQQYAAGRDDTIVMVTVDQIKRLRNFPPKKREPTATATATAKG